MDTSAWAKRYLKEEGTDSVLRWAESEPLVTSRITAVEATSAVLRRQRASGLSTNEAEMLLAQLWLDLEAAFIIELTDSVTRLAQIVVRRHGLRTGDAVQLGSALWARDLLAGPVEFVCFDRRLNEAARAEGLITPMA